MSIFECKKIIVVGNEGSGKTTFAEELAEILGLPLIHLDKEYWQPGWRETPREQWFEKQKQLISGDSWIIDGNYESSLKERFQAADAVIFMDIAVPVCCKNLIKRRIKYSTTPRSDLPEVCPEFIRVDQLRKVLLYPQTERNRVLSYMHRFPREEMHSFYTLSAAKKWLAALRRGEEPKQR